MHPWPVDDATAELLNQAERRYDLKLWTSAGFNALLERLGCQHPEHQAEPAALFRPTAFEHLAAHLREAESGREARRAALLRQFLHRALHDVQVDEPIDYASWEPVNGATLELEDGQRLHIVEGWLEPPQQ